jgi:hypothetical protein
MAPSKTVLGARDGQMHSALRRDCSRRRSVRVNGICKVVEGRGRKERVEVGASGGGWARAREKAKGRASSSRAAVRRRQLVSVVVVRTTTTMRGPRRRCSHGLLLRAEAGGGTRSTLGLSGRAAHGGQGAHGPPAKEASDAIARRRR